ncbi:MAG: hypothetical protein AB8F74_15700 [Saprospiraceae bacterium]
MENITFQYPAWYILFCVMLGLIVATALYFKDRSFSEQSGWLKWLLGSIRFLLVTLIAILLLSPLLKSLITETKKPVIVLAQDQSESIIADMDDATKTKYQEDFNALATDLGAEYDVKTYAFGNEVREGVDFEFSDKVSNISDLLKYLYDLYSNQNLGAVVLASDGIYNEGSNPIYASAKLAAPIYTVALGDTIPKKDLVLKRVFHNKIAYLDDKFSIQIDIDAQNCSGGNTILNVRSVGGGNTVLERIPIAIDKNDFFTTKEIILDAKKSGVQRFRISLNEINGEVTTANNTQDIFVDVLDARQKILILANNPHPDITAIKQSISGNKNYEITTAYINDLKEDVGVFDFVILHQLPSSKNDAAGVLKTLYEKNIPRLYIVGMQSDLGKFSKIQPLLDLRADGRNTNDVQAVVANNFSLFTIDEDIKKELPNFAPLVAPFGEFTDNANTQVLLYQRIGKIETEYPLLLFGEQNNIKMGVLAAEGIWKWRLFDYLQHENHDIVNEVISKSVQYLTLKEDKRKFRVSVNKNIFNENEPLFFDAELYNNSYELVNEPDATITISNEEGKNYNFTFNKKNKAYDLNAGLFPVGNYTFKGSVMSSGEQLTYNGQFSVQPIQLEVYETTADHGLLRLLSEKYGGEMVAPNNMRTIAEKVKAKQSVKPTVYQTTKTRSVINLKWIFFVLLTLLTLEWFLRRYFGAY